MINVSEGFKTEVSAASRKMGSKVVFQIVDVTAQSEAAATVTTEEVLSQKIQLFDGILDQSQKFATMEPNYLKLDGSFSVPPTVLSGVETGWWSSEMSGADGAFTTPQVLTIDFTTNHSSIGLSIVFDSIANEYADTFTITAYNSSGGTIYTTTITGNSDSKFILNQSISNYRKITISISKWGAAYRRVRIADIGFGIIEEYTGSELISVKVLEEIDTLSSTVTANEMIFTLDNSDKRFNLLNPSGIYPYLQRRQMLQAYIGTLEPGIEYAPMGVYYLTEWKSDEGTLTASFTARDVLDLLAQSTYRKGKYQTRTLYNLAVDVLADAAVSNYIIDSALNSISVTGNISVMSHREALQLIAFAGMAVVYSDRYGKVIIKQLSSTITDQLIDYNNTYASPQIKLDKLVNTVDISVNTYNADAALSELAKVTVNITGTSSIWVEYDLAQSVSATLSSGTINSATYYGNAALLNIAASGSVTITVTGTKLNMASSIYELVDGSAPAGEQPLTVKIDNSLITTTSIAGNCASWVIAEYKKRYLYAINWRQNPALEAGDIVTIEDDFSANKTARIIKQEFNYNGALSGQTGGRG